MTKFDTKTMRLYMRKKRAELRKLGLCTRCGKHPAVEGSDKCEKCREYQREYFRRRQERLRKEKEAKR